MYAEILAGNGTNSSFTKWVGTCMQRAAVPPKGDAYCLPKGAMPMIIPFDITFCVVREDAMPPSYFWYSAMSIEHV